MIVSGSANKLALSLARQGQHVVYRCKDMWEVNYRRNELEDMIRRRHWFSYWVLDHWRVMALDIKYKGRGTIHFAVGWTFVGVDIALEVLAS